MSKILGWVMIDGTKISVADLGILSEKSFKYHGSYICKICGKDMKVGDRLFCTIPAGKQIFPNASLCECCLNINDLRKTVMEVKKSWEEAQPHLKKWR